MVILSVIDPGPVNLCYPSSKNIRSNMHEMNTFLLGNMCCLSGRDAIQSRRALSTYVLTTAASVLEGGQLEVNMTCRIQPVQSPQLSNITEKESAVIYEVGNINSCLRISEPLAL